jgi:phosphoribosyl-ATP pyrophosphohydrolase
MSENTNDPAWPVLVEIGEEIRTAALMNRKAFRKSTETGVPWVVNPLTQKVLPWPGGPEILSLKEAPGCFRLILPPGSSMEPYGSSPPAEADPDDRISMAGFSGSTEDTSSSSDVMGRLSALVAERRKTLPEGSYTTHLFKEGLDKIRKKTGEEAVELILARDTDDVVFEAADLAYHLLVLLEASELSWDDVSRELNRRHRG